jgi:hypothetical protein
MIPIPSFRFLILIVPLDSKPFLTQNKENTHESSTARVGNIDKILFLV